MDATPPTAAPPSSGGGTPPLRMTPLEEQRDIDENKDVAALSYLWILSVVVLYRRRDSAFAQYHAKQGVWLFLLSIPLWLVPGVGHLLEFLVLAGMIIGFLNAAQGRYHDVPLIGKLAKGTLTLRDLWKMCIEGALSGWRVLRKVVAGSGASSSPHPSSHEQSQARKDFTIPVPPDQTPDAAAKWSAAAKGGGLPHMPSVPRQPPRE